MLSSCESVLDAMPEAVGAAKSPHRVLEDLLQLELDTIGSFSPGKAFVTGAGASFGTGIATWGSPSGNGIPVGRSDVSTGEVEGIATKGSPSGIGIAVGKSCTPTPASIASSLKELSKEFAGPLPTTIVASPRALSVPPMRSPVELAVKFPDSPPTKLERPPNNANSQCSEAGAAAPTLLPSDWPLAALFKNWSKAPVTAPPAAPGAAPTKHPDPARDEACGRADAEVLAVTGPAPVAVDGPVGVRVLGVIFDPLDPRPDRRRPGHRAGRPVKWLGCGEDDPAEDHQPVDQASRTGPPPPPDS